MDAKGPLIRRPRNGMRGRFFLRETGAIRSLLAT
jgi:hypothetical protein